MSRAVLEFLAWQLHEAFEGKPEHSLVANLSSVTNDTLDQLPSAGGRTLRDLIVHCASVKRMHVDHAFAEGELSWWTTWDGEGALEDANLEGLMAWLRRGHDEARGAVGALQGDDELLNERKTHWGELRETRFLIDAIMIHDIYHAGEINHLRALLQSGR